MNMKYVGKFYNIKFNIKTYLLHAEIVYLFYRADVNNRARFGTLHVSLTVLS